MGAINDIARVGCAGVEEVSLFGVQTRFLGEWALDDGIRFVSVLVEIESQNLEEVELGVRGTICWYDGEGEMMI